MQSFVQPVLKAFDIIKSQKILLQTKYIFGIGNRIGLENPSIQELHILSYIRYYYSILKIESNSRHLHEHQLSSINGSSILFEQDAPQVVTIEKSYHIQFQYHLSSHECTRRMLPLYSYNETIPFITTLAAKNLPATAGYNAKSENSPMPVGPRTAAG